MASLVKIDYVLEIAQTHGCKCWRMWDDGGELLDRRESETASITQVLADLRASFERVSGSFVSIRLSPKKLTKGGDQITNVYNYKVKCLSAGDFETAEAPAEIKLAKGAGSSEIYSLLSELKVQLAEQKKDVEIRELQRQLQEQKKGGGKNRLLEQYLTKILLSSDVKEISAAAPVAGHTEAPAKAAAPVAGTQQELVQQLQRLKKLDNDFVNTLKRLADYAEKNPGALDQLKTIL